MKTNPYVKLAKKALEFYIKNNKEMQKPTDLPKEMLEKKAGVFVSLKKWGDLRGCIGTTSPTTNSIADEIIQNAISAGTRDPRFPPVNEKELSLLTISVDVLKAPEPIESISELDTNKYGVIVRKGRRSGLLLPNLEGIDTPKEQVDIALRKAGIYPEEDYKLERFEVIRHK
ncbi:MAG: AmmeMemoRadiSam system protein A [Bacillota bacterium]